MFSNKKTKNKNFIKKKNGKASLVRCPYLEADLLH